jgi:CBS domain-containing protein
VCACDSTRTLLCGTSYAGFSHVASHSKANPFFAEMNEGGSRSAGPFLVVARPDDTLRRVLQMITEHGVHRVYLCEADSMKPIGVITLTDVLQLALDAAQEEEGRGAGPGEGTGEEEPATTSVATVAQGVLQWHDMPEC